MAKKNLNIKKSTFSDHKICFWGIKKKTNTSSCLHSVNSAVGGASEHWPLCPLIKHLDRLYFDSQRYTVCPFLGVLHIALCNLAPLRCQSYPAAVHKEMLT